jgi:hypothetical protein
MVVSWRVGFAIALSAGLASVRLVVPWSRQLYWLPIPERDWVETLQ